MDNGHIRQRNNGGFTLLELMIVIVILGILGAIVAPKFMDEPHKARVVQAKMQIENLSTAVKKFYLDNGFYPSTEQGLEALVTRPAIGKTPKNYPANGYITKIPKDPWGNDYVYTAPGQKVPFEIMSLGSDGAEGGEGEAADIWGEDVPTAERRSAGFTLLELLIVLVIMGVLVAVGAGALSVERNPLYTGAQALVTASSTARSRALLLNAPVTLELGQTFMEISSENGDRPLREAFPKGMSAASVDEHYLLGGSQKLLFHPLGVVQEHVVHLQSGRDTLSVYIPATGTARILEGQFSLEQIRKEFL